MNLFNQKIITLIEDIPAHVYWKKDNGEYLGCNKKQLKSLKLKNQKEIIGLTDLDLAWRKQARVLMDNDKNVLHNSHPRTFIEKAEIDKSIFTYISCKFSLKHTLLKEKIIFGISSENNIRIDFYEICQLITSLLSFNQPNHYSLKNLLKYALKNLPLSNREKECIYYLMKGKSNKAISNYLNLSPRTVESYMENILNKLALERKADIIDYIWSLIE
jgi:DNA-binding CsgD family transcriptional regulator